MDIPSDLEYQATSQHKETKDPAFNQANSALDGSHNHTSHSSGNCLDHIQLDLLVENDCSQTPRSAHTTAANQPTGGSKPKTSASHCCAHR